MKISLCFLRFSIAVSLMVSSIGAVRPVDADAPIKVMTTTTDLAALAAAVGSDLVEVQPIARGSQDPHYVDARPSYMRKLHGADLLIYNGLELEIGWLPLLVEGSRNRRVQAGGEGALNASAGLPILEIPTGELDRSQGDIHPEGNPHYTLSPINGRHIASAITARLQRLRPAQFDELAAQRDHFTALLDDSVATWASRAQAWRGTRVIAHHKQWEYLADWLGLEIVAYIEEKPGIPPTPQHVSHLVDLIRREQISIILHATFTDPRPARQLAARTSTRVVELPAAVAAVDGAQDYLSLFGIILDRLDEALTGSAGS